MTETTGFKPALSFAEVCDRGKMREENQDRVRHAATALGELVMVADGIGGYRGGATAAQIVVDTMEASIASREAGYSPARAIAEAAATANTAVFDAAASGDTAFRNMGSTLVLALFTRESDGARAWIGHIGDSRAYLARNGSLVRLTRDHSAVQELLDQHEITLEEAKKSPQASVLTRSLGHFPEVEIEISMVDLEPGDVFLLCTDGLWGFVDELALEQAALASGMELEKTVAALLNLALDAGGHDNIGIEMVAYDPASEPPAEASEQPDVVSESPDVVSVRTAEIPVLAEPARPASKSRRGALILWLIVLFVLVAVALVGSQEHWFSQ
jgi:PPM family protein phosphatase